MFYLFFLTYLVHSIMNNGHFLRFVPKSFFFLDFLFLKPSCLVDEILGIVVGI